VRRFRLPFLPLLIVGILLAPQTFALSADTAQKTVKKKRTPPPDSETVTPVPREIAWWKNRQESINDHVKKGDAQLLLIGDSITQGWEGSGKNVWQKYYDKRHAVNLGIGGDQTQHVLWRLDHGNLDGIHPKLAVLMIGTNNCGRNTPEQIYNGVKAIVEKLRAKLPETKVLVLAIFPRGANEMDRLRKVNEAANERIANLDDGKNVFYLDIGKKFLEPDGTLTKQIMPDLLHLSPEGYEIWAASTEPSVAKLMGEAQ
jgi:lysophospholipase L1-like esterase